MEYGRLPNNRRPASRPLHRPPKPSVQPISGLPSEDQPQLQRCSCGGSCPACRKDDESKLKIGKSVDRFEREADENADRVMRMTAASGAPPSEKDEEEEVVQRQVSGPGTAADSRQGRGSQQSRERQRAAGTDSRRTKAPPTLEAPAGDGRRTEAPPTLKTPGRKSGAPGTSSLSQELKTSKSGGRRLPEKTLADMSHAFDADFSSVRIHTGPQAATLNAQLHARAFAQGSHLYFAPGQFRPETSAGKRLLAHELTHVLQQRSVESGLIQRALVLVPPNPNVAPPVLTPAETQEAIRFNRRRYREDVIRQIQGVVGGPVTGVMEPENIRLIALVQAQFNLNDVDGKVGPDTFDLLVRELTAENAPQNTCMTMFRIDGPQTPLNLGVPGVGLVDVWSRFDVEALFSPRCNCSDFEYRQHICGTVTRTRGGVVTDMGPRFLVPGGGLPACPGWVEDGNTNNAQNGRYGHRNHPDRPENRYLDAQGNLDMANGCRFVAWDTPGMWSTQAVSGDLWNFNMRFFGDIERGGARIERKFWSLIDNVTIP